MFGLQTKVIALLVALSALIGAYLYGRHDGARLERAGWEQRENDALRQANADLHAAHRKLRDQEHAAAQRVQQVSTEYQKELTDVRETNRSRLAALDRGDLRLRDPAATHQACADRMSGAPAGAGGRDGPAPGELSGAASRFLLELTGEADEVARQLAACQAIVHGDRAAVRR